MKEYTTNLPAFSQSIKIIETTDRGHANNVNVSTMQLLQNTLVNKQSIDALSSDNMEQAFYSVFTKVEEQEDETPLSEADIKTAISTPWDGQSSYDITAMSKDDINNAIHTPWDGKSSTDETALSSADIKKATTL